MEHQDMVSDRLSNLCAGVVGCLSSDCDFHPSLVSTRLALFLHPPALLLVSFFSSPLLSMRIFLACLALAALPLTLAMPSAAPSWKPVPFTQSVNTTTTTTTYTQYRNDNKNDHTRTIRGFTDSLFVSLSPCSHLCVLLSGDLRCQFL